MRKSPSMKITSIARAISKNPRFNIMGIRPGEKLHEQMIGLDESNNTYEFKDYYVIIPAIFNKSKFKQFLKKSKKVKNNFVYSSNTNTKWLTQNKFKKWLTDFIKNQDKLS